MTILAIRILNTTLSLRFRFRFTTLTLRKNHYEISGSCSNIFCSLVIMVCHVCEQETMANLSTCILLSCAVLMATIVTSSNAQKMYTCYSCISTADARCNDPFTASTNLPTCTGNHCTKTYWTASGWYDYAEVITVRRTINSTRFRPTPICYTSQ